jgi:hypothetical protein
MYSVPLAVPVDQPVGVVPTNAIEFTAQGKRIFPKAALRALFKARTPAMPVRLVRSVDDIAGPLPFRGMPDLAVAGRNWRSVARTVCFGMISGDAAIPWHAIAHTKSAARSPSGQQSIRDGDVLRW